MTSQSHAATVSIPSATFPGERLVAATPRTVEQLLALGYAVKVQAGAGEAASYPDHEYVEAGAALVDRDQAWAGDIVLAINPPGDDEQSLLTPGATLISMLAPHTNPELTVALAKRGITALALDAIPRLSRAQALDVLSTIANVAGYRAVIEAAEAYGGMFGGQVTAAGKTPPARVFVIGGGVAGLAAIGAAVSLGAQVRAFDVRPETSEQMESLGATAVTLDSAQQEVSADGYAGELTADQERATLELYAAEAAAADVVITTALVRGSAPTTLTADAVASMRPGSVVVDLAAQGGGNCELTVPGERVVTANGVQVLGWTDLAGRMPRHTSQLLGTNIANLLALLTPDKNGVVTLDMDDVLVRGMTVAHEGEVLWPPPPIEVSAAPQASPGVATQAPPEPQAGVEPARASAAKKGAGRTWSMAIAGAALAVALAFSNPAFLAMFTVFVLAVVIGYYVISSVSHSLHTPLMSQTNAISGIILVGALLQLGSDSLVVTVLAFVAAAVASINVFGGFLVTYRMLGMFTKGA